MKGRALCLSIKIHTQLIFMATKKKAVKKAVKKSAKKAVKKAAKKTKKI